MAIFLDKRAVKQIRQSATDAVDDGDTETLREDVMDAFSEEQIEEIERRLESGDMYDFISDTLEEWDGDDVDELFELLETNLRHWRRAQIQEPGAGGRRRGSRRRGRGFLGRRR